MILSGAIVPTLGARGTFAAGGTKNVICLSLRSAPSHGMARFLAVQYDDHPHHPNKLYTAGVLCVFAVGDRRGAGVSRGFVEPPGRDCCLFEAQRGLCFHCAEPMGFLRGSAAHKHFQATREHIYPFSGRGRMMQNNIVLAHEICNNRRGNASPTAEEISRTTALYKSLGLTAFYMTEDQKNFATEDHLRQKLFTEARNRLLPHRVVKAKTAVRLGTKSVAQIERDKFWESWTCDREQP